MVLCNIMVACNFQQRSFTTAIILFGVPDIVSLAAVPIMHQETITEHRLTNKNSKYLDK